MKQFSLEEYLANPSKKVVTRDGRSVRIVCTDRVSEKEYPLLALVRTDGKEIVQTYTTNGQYYLGDTNHALDLLFAPEKHEGWLNLFKDTLGIIYGGCVYTSKDEAKEEEHPTDKESHVATVKIEWEE